MEIIWPAGWRMILSRPGVYTLPLTIEACMADTREFHSIQLFESVATFMKSMGLRRIE